VVTSQFPELHETFILRELLALQRAGVSLHIVSLKRCRDEIVHPQAQPLIQHTTYLTLDRGRVWIAALCEMARHPVRACTTLGWAVRYHAWPPVTLAKSVAIWIQALALARQLRHQGITHLHAHWATLPTTAAVIASRWVGIPFSFTAHAWDIFVRNPSLPEKVRLARHVFTCTEYNRRYLSHWCPGDKHKVVLNYHGVDLTQFRTTRSAAVRSSETDKPVPLFLSVGRLVETKGFASLLEAYRLLRERGVEFSAVIVGQGPLWSALAQQLRVSGLSGLVELRPAMRQEELRELYASAFAFVLPSVIAPNADRDGIPNVILEAMAMGLPVIATRVSGIPEAVQDRRTGLLVPPHDPKQLARACETLLERRNFTRVLGDHGRMWVETQFDERDHMQRLVHQMKELLGADAAGQPARTRVLYVIWSLAMGGAERVVSLLAQHLDRSRYEPRVVCLNDPGVLAMQLEVAGVPVTALRKRGPVDLRAFWRLVTIIRRERIDLVHTHLWGGNVWGRLAAWWTRRPVIATEHSTDIWKPSWYFLIDRWLARHTQRLVTVSKAVSSFYISRGIPARLCLTIPNGVETTRFPAPRRSPLYDTLGWGAGTPVFVMIGRLVEVKHIEVFIEAMAAVVATRPAARGLIVGEGPLRSQLEHQIHARGLTGRLVLTGSRDDIPAILRGARAMVLTSRREGLPMALIEAMASGVPAISTAVGGIPEVIEDGCTGWLVPSGDRQALVQRLLALADDPRLAERVGAAAQAVARERWSVDVMVRRHEMLYDELLTAPVVRIVYVVDHLDPGGAQSQLLEVARRLPRDRFACSVISLSATRTRLLEQFSAADVHVTLIDQSGKWSWACFLKLHRSLRTAHPHIVHTWLFTADLYGRLAAWAARVPIVVSSVRSVETGKKPHYIWVDRLLQRITDTITVNAEAIRPVLVHRDRIRPEKIWTIYNGVDLSAFSPTAANGAFRRAWRFGTDPVVGMVCRLMPEKDPLTFVRAAALVARAIPAARFVIVGDGPMQEALSHEANRLRIMERMTLTGFRPERAAVLQAMDVVVLSSLYEGCANAILEAMAMAKPVVATNVGGNHELVVNDVTGRLVSSQDPQAMAEAVIALLRNPERAHAMGHAGRERVERCFTVERMVEETTTLYARLLDSQGSRQ